MAQAPQKTESFLPIRRVAFRLGVPVKWLRDEVAAGRVPFLRVGRRVMLNVQTVERALLERAEQEQQEASP